MIDRDDDSGERPIPITWTNVPAPPLTMETLERGARAMQAAARHHIGPPMSPAELNRQRTIALAIKTRRLFIAPDVAKAIETDPSAQAYYSQIRALGIDLIVAHHAAPGTVFAMEDLPLWVLSPGGPMPRKMRRDK